MSLLISAHLTTALRCWETFQERKRRTAAFNLDGKSLQIADIVAISHQSASSISVPQAVLSGLQASVDVLTDHLDRGLPVYGTNSGFGGNADTRTNKVVALQAALMQLTQAGILTQHDRGLAVGDKAEKPLAMPAAWVRSMMLVRINSNLRGHSAVSADTLQTVLTLLNRGITPVVPLRGSISASGDLMPLAYIAGAIEGSPDVYVQLDIDGSTKVMPAQDALAVKGVQHVQLRPKEGLGLINGTSGSAGLASLVVYKAHQQGVAVQALTALAVEALGGTTESFDSFIAEVRPHAGQVEVAHNILAFLSHSRLAKHSGTVPEEGLVQDRYSLRTASQWIGPCLEDIQLSHQQISVELNSTTDNPLVDTRGGGRILCGGNFQAASVTSAVEKVRSSLQMLGRLLFVQVQEMVDPSLSNGLPANLAADDPSLSFTCKGVDIAMASYMAELAYLAHPMSAHIQVAEMHNQAVNSMAFATARYTMEAADIVDLMLANHLFVVLQAIDLRVLHALFLQSVSRELDHLANVHFGSVLNDDLLSSLTVVLGSKARVTWQSSNKLDLEERCHKVADALLPVLLNRLQHDRSFTLQALSDFCDNAKEKIYRAWLFTWDAFNAERPTMRYLGSVGQRLYHFVRNVLKVPFHQGLVEHPQYRNDTMTDPRDRVRQKKTVGSWVSDIHAAITDGRLDDVLMTFVRDLNEREANSGVHGYGNATIKRCDSDY